MYDFNFLKLLQKIERFNMLIYVIIIVILSFIMADTGVGLREKSLYDRYSGALERMEDLDGFVAFLKEIPLIQYMMKVAEVGDTEIFIRGGILREFIRGTDLRTYIRDGHDIDVYCVEEHVHDPDLTTFLDRISEHDKAMCQIVEHKVSRCTHKAKGKDGQFYDMNPASNRFVNHQFVVGSGFGIIKIDVNVVRNKDDAYMAPDTDINSLLTNYTKMYGTDVFRWGQIHVYSRIYDSIPTERIIAHIVSEEFEILSPYASKVRNRKMLVRICKMIEAGYAPKELFRQVPKIVDSLRQIDTYDDIPPVVVRNFWKVVDMVTSYTTPDFSFSACVRICVAGKSIPKLISVIEQPHSPFKNIIMRDQIKTLNAIVLTGSLQLFRAVVAMCDVVEDVRDEFYLRTAVVAGDITEIDKSLEKKMNTHLYKKFVVTVILDAYANDKMDIVKAVAPRALADRTLQIEIYMRAFKREFINLQDVLGSMKELFGDALIGAIVDNYDIATLLHLYGDEPSVFEMVYHTVRSDQVLSTILTTIVRRMSETNTYHKTFQFVLDTIEPSNIADLYGIVMDLSQEKYGGEVSWMLQYLISKISIQQSTWVRIRIHNDIHSLRDDDDDIPSLVNDDDASVTMLQLEKVLEYISYRPEFVADEHLNAMSLKMWKGVPLDAPREGTSAEL